MVYGLMDQLLEQNTYYLPLPGKTNPLFFCEVHVSKLPEEITVCKLMYLVI